MEILFENIDLILCAAVILIAAAVFARRGQISLLRELILSLSNGVDSAELYQKLPAITKLLVSSNTVDKLISENTVKGETVQNIYKPTE